MSAYGQPPLQQQHQPQIQQQQPPQGWLPQPPLPNAGYLNGNAPHNVSDVTPLIQMSIKFI